MKTCSFRGAQPQSNSDGLFCGMNEPQAQYTMQSREDLFCLCCHPYNEGKKRQLWPVVDFASSSMDRFANGYTSYLNCPAVNLILAIVGFIWEWTLFVLLSRLVIRKILPMQ